MPADIHLLDVVALKEALPEHDLLPGQVGTVVEELAPDICEVEFSDDEGRAYAFATVSTDVLLKLHHHLVSAR